jgi:hypothetical protein
MSTRSVIIRRKDKGKFMHKKIVLTCAVILAISSSAQANSFSKDLQLLVNYGAVDRADLIHNIKVYDSLLTNMTKLVKQGGPKSRLDSIEQITRIEKSVEEQKGWLIYLPQGTDSSTGQLDAAIARSKRAAMAPLSKTYQPNLLKEISSAQTILRQTETDLKSGK